jgi:ketosteroid isomerase-like protein
MRSVELVLSFVAAINDHDVARIVDLCTDDHEFVDAHGQVAPAETLAAAWRGYFQFMPRYGIEVESVLSDGDVVAVFGQAWGGLNAHDAGDRFWRRPCAWRACVRGDKVKGWQVYVDTKAVFDLLTQ